MCAFSTSHAYQSNSNQILPIAQLVISDRALAYDIRQSNITIGCKSSSDVVLDYDFVSKEHFCIEYKDGSFICKHSKTTNGRNYSGPQATGKG